MTVSGLHARLPRRKFRGDGDVAPSDASATSAATVRRPAATENLVSAHDRDTTPPRSPDRYQCPMHPEVQSDRPGRCPISGIKLVLAAVLRQVPWKVSARAPISRVEYLECMEHLRREEATHPRMTPRPHALDASTRWFKCRAHQRPPPQHTSIEEDRVEPATAGGAASTAGAATTGAAHRAH